VSSDRQTSPPSDSESPRSATTTAPASVTSFLQSGAGQQTRPVRRSAGTRHPVQCAGRRRRSPHSAGPPGGASRRMGIRTRSSRACCAWGLGPSTGGGVGARATDDRLRSRRAGGPSARTTGRKPGRTSLRHRYATGPSLCRRQHSWLHRLSLLTAFTEPIRFSGKEEDLRMVRKPVQERRRKCGIAEDFYPA
jgi:hypothetical protein